MDILTEIDCANAPCETCQYYNACSRRIEYELDMEEDYSERFNFDTWEIDE